VTFDFSDDQLAIRDAVEAICADFGADYWLERGWFGGLTFPQEYHVERGLRKNVLPLLAPVTRELGCATSPSRRSDCRSRIDRRSARAAHPGHGRATPCDTSRINRW
jgi:hypothetical protein